MTGENRVHLTSEMVRTIAHPLRARLLGLLRIEGPSTATKLAERTGTNSGATSYHLRQLAEVGLVEEDERENAGRQRWWRSAHRESSWTETEHGDDPESKAAADWLVRYSHRQHSRWVDEWLDSRMEWPRRWRDAADQSDFLVEVNQEQLEELNRRVHELISEYRSMTPGDGAEQAVVLYYSLPRAGFTI